MVELAAAGAVQPAYRELACDGLVTAQVGVGTFIAATPPRPWLAAHDALRHDLLHWLSTARRAGLDDELIEALFSSTLRSGDDSPVTPTSESADAA